MPIDDAISTRSWKECIERCMCPTIQKGIAKFWLIQTRV